MPLRGDGRLELIGGFYAQWEWGVTELRYVSVEFLQQLLEIPGVAGAHIMAPQNFGEIPAVIEGSGVAGKRRKL